MLPERVEQARRCYDAFQRGDLETALEPLSEAFTLEDPPRADTARYQGPEGFMTWLGEWLSMFEDWHFEVDRVLDADPYVLVLGRDWGRGKGSGVLVEEHFGHLWSFREGELISMLVFNDWGLALEAAGLSV